MLFSLAAVMIVMIFLRAPFHITSLLFWIPLFMLFLFTCGLSLLLSALAAKFRDVEHLYSVLVLAWMYLTPLFYPLSAIPETYRWIMELNPMTYYVTLFRDLVMYGSYGTPETWRWCIASATGSLLLGSLVFKKMQRNFILYI
jgi:ABC-2 type transport system permease protein